MSMRNTTFRLMAQASSSWSASSTLLRAGARLAPRTTATPLLARGLTKTVAPTRDPMTGEVTQLPDIDATTVTVTNTQNPKHKPPSSKLIFGHTFTDHMLTIPWTSLGGWGTPEIKPYGPLELDPSATVLHYAFTLFEGMKAYRTEDGTVRLFRPDMNMARMNKSATRLALPTFSSDDMVELIRKLVEIDADWIPTEKGHSLYIRPTLIGTQKALGVNPSNSAMLFVICCPVGPYYPAGFKPVQLLATEKYVRAPHGGIGAYKLGANYAVGIVPQKEAAKMGYTQNLWLLGEEKALTEVGTMNLFVAFKQADGSVELVTPPLDDVILPGVTRDSVLELAKDHASGKNKLHGLPEKFKVNERKVVMQEILDAEKNGTLLEVFGTGTAAVISAVDKIGYQGRDIKIPTGVDGMGDIAKTMFDTVVGIQTGEIPHEWSVIAKEGKKN